MRRSPMAEPQTKAAVECRMIAPQFVVPDVVAAAEYYRDVLGFRVRGYFLDPPIYAIVARDSVEIHFGKLDRGIATTSPNIQRREGSIDAYIWGERPRSSIRGIERTRRKNCRASDDAS